VVKDSRELARAVIHMLQDRDASRARGNAAREALLACSGVTGRYLKAIEPFLRGR
jgi:hypothetical protein